MTNLTILIFALLFFQLTAFSQPCLPEGITCTSQEQIDNFQTNYPGCTEIEGDVAISGDDITNLNGLSVLTSIGGDVEIANNDILTSLSGLENLVSIGGTLTIGYASFTYQSGWQCHGNLSLTDLSGLDNLSLIGENLIIECNDQLVSLTGLGNLASIGGNLAINGNDVLVSLTGIENLNSVTGNINIGDGMWTGMPFPATYYHGNPSLTSLAALNNITSIGDVVSIIGNDTLEILDGLENIISNGASLEIIGNNAMTSLTGLEDVTDIYGDLWLGENESLNTLTGLENLTSIEGSLFIGKITIHGPGGNPSLTSLTGLQNLTTIGGCLEVYTNDLLSSMTGLESLTSIGEGLTVKYNLALTNLTGLDNLHTIGGYLYCDANETLSNLSGLDNIEASSITFLGITGNFELSTCDVESICDYLASPGGGIEIENNAPGCNSLEEVDSLCNNVAVREINFVEAFTISPNPLKSNAVITCFLNASSHITLKILDINGREVITLLNEVKQQGEEQVVCNISGLPAGIYFCVLRTAQQTTTKKIIKLN